MQASIRITGTAFTQKVDNNLFVLFMRLSFGLRIYRLSDLVVTLNLTRIIQGKTRLIKHEDSNNRDADTSSPLTGRKRKLVLNSIRLVRDDKLIFIKLSKSKFNMPKTMPNAQHGLLNRTKI